MNYELAMVVDAADPDRIARFWMLALGGYDYPGSAPDGVPGSPPEGFDSWEAWADAHGIPADMRYRFRTIIDTSGAGRPDIHFRQVPEGKTVKNRLHLDIRVARTVPAERRQAAQEAEAERLVAAGATVTGRHTDDYEGSWLLMHDPEGNEFCIT